MAQLHLPVILNLSRNRIMNVSLQINLDPDQLLDTGTSVTVNWVDAAGELVGCRRPGRTSAAPVDPSDEMFGPLPLATYTLTHGHKASGLCVRTRVDSLELPGLK